MLLEFVAPLGSRFAGKAGGIESAFPADQVDQRCVIPDLSFLGERETQSTLALGGSTTV
jgi:hypothetical protein